jgi:Trk K+ transport system NAD-binding subunit
VVARDDPRKLLGLLRRGDLVRAYDAALTRHAARRHLINQTRLDAVTPEAVKVVEVQVQEGSPLSGRKLKEIAWPPDSIVASIRRKQQVIIPRGETVLLGGDILAVVTETPYTDAVMRLGEPRPQVETQ